MTKVARSDQLPAHVVKGIATYNFHDEDTILEYNIAADVFTGEYIHFVETERGGDWETLRKMTPEEVAEVVARLQPITRKNLHEYVS